ncbi:hypothetical protein [Flammeovirga agarivorans]|uniref:Uncharacterized protein n=1 Tax=Flammeovirga agarivorans TaxID=2726742 RepID=A0A7X8SNB0_9BACT|nr:hypothetical protein [Flammeovirga agarivorans]NLR93308.1 hypothetical protein [Flammeovirga agarivorans]
MKRIAVLFFFCFYLISTTYAQLPDELWQYAGTNTYMYFENDIYKNSRFFMQTDNHFLTFNYKNFTLEQLRLINQDEIGKNYLDKEQKEPLDLLSMFVEIKGTKYKIVRLEDEQNYAGELIESGKFYQRRYYTDLKLENGPEVKLSFEIYTWNDVLGFKLIFDEGKIPMDNSKLIIELKLPEDQYSIKSKKGQIIAKAKNGKSWLLENQINTNKVSKDKGVLIAETAVTNKVANLILHSATSNEGKVNITASDLNNTHKEVVVKKDVEQQATVISLNDTFKPVDGMERVALTLENTSDKPQLQRLIFQRLKSVRAITGVSIILRDKEGHPTGIPIQISKNWHGQKNTWFKFRGPWLRAYTMVSLPPNSTVELELSKVSGFWGTLPAVSHNQLSLTGWGKKRIGNHQLWDQTAMGAFGESICYEPDGGQANTLITDVRPFLIKSDDDSKIGPRKWSWTPNVGGGDFMRVYDEKGTKHKIKRIKSHIKRNCPNLTEVTYTGVTSDDAANYSLTASIMRNDDYVRGVYTLEVEVNDTFNFDRLALAQFGSETYSYSVENKIAWGNAEGLIKEMNNIHKEKQYTNKDLIIEGKNPWFSMHEAKNMESNNYAVWGNKGVVLKEWSAKIGGQKIAPRFSTYSSSKTRAKEPVTLVEVNLPSDIKQLHKGDKIRMVMELCVFPQEAKSYYGTNEEFRKALVKDENTWRLMWRESLQNDVKVKVKKGKVVRNYPLKIQAKNNEVSVDLANGLGYVPVTVSNLSDYKDFNFTFKYEGKEIVFDQERFGNDYYQVDYDPTNKTWEVTFSVPTDNHSLEN